MMTSWGYTITGAESIPDMLSTDDLNVFTGNKYAAQETRMEVEITAACAAIRNYVGWHLFPSLPCEVRTNMLDRRVTVVGHDLLIQLPARVVSEVASVVIGGVTYTDYFCDTNGLLRVFNVGVYDRKTLIVVNYTAGITVAMMAPIQELIAHRVTHALAVPAGVTSEASGGVSITYNATWINNSRATALAGDNKELLIPYKVQGVF